MRINRNIDLRTGLEQSKLVDIEIKEEKLEIFVNVVFNKN